MLDGSRRRFARRLSKALGALILRIVYGKDRRTIIETPRFIVIFFGFLTVVWVLSILCLFLGGNIVLPLIMVVGYPAAIAIWTIIVRKRQREEEKRYPFLYATDNKRKNTQKAAAKVTEPTPIEEETIDIPAEIRRYKELLDIGAITQEEYDAKQKQLLGLTDQNLSDVFPRKKGKYLVCPDCGRRQLSSRTDCWNCGKTFEEEDYEYIKQKLVRNEPEVPTKAKKKYLLCPACGRTQLSSRTDCWNCKRGFEEQDYEYE